MNIDNVFNSFKQINFIYLIPIFIFLSLFYLGVAYRWLTMFIDFRKRPHFRNIFKITIMNYMGNSIMPARLGELMRIYLIKKKENIKPVTTLATIALEKVFDGLAIMSIFIIVLFFSKATKYNIYSFESLSYAQLKHWGYIFSGAYVFCTFILFILRNQIIFLARTTKPKFKSISNFLVKFVRGLSAFKNFKDISSVYIYSILLWIAHSLTIYFCLKACNVDVPLAASFFLLAFIGLAYFIPSSPGAIGTIEFFIILGLSCYGVDKDKALAFALIYHVIEILPVSILGFYYFIGESINVKEIEKNIKS